MSTSTISRDPPDILDLGPPGGPGPAAPARGPASPRTDPTFSREVRLASRPLGVPTLANFELARVELPPLGEHQVLVRNTFMSVDPYMRGRMNEGPSYVPAFALGQVLSGGAIGEVVESRDSEFKPGDAVTSEFGWREYFVASPADLQPISHQIQPSSVYLGLLGMTGMTAWVGLNLIEAKKGETLFISGAAGAVGNVAGQLARLRGCRVVGCAGSPEKVRFLRDECGFDAAFDYNDGPISDQLKVEAPDGIDVYFDNVGGAALEGALTALRPHGRIIACGSISGYNDPVPRAGPSNLFEIIGKRLTIRGFIVRDWLGSQGAFRREVGDFLQEGRLKSKETVVEGIDNAADAFLGLFSGKNLGKMVVKLAQPATKP
jgi:NADPH-dependent curcumin reductase CurA